jgi:excinuclease UvrABC helicase subunit UvrB
MASIPAAMDNRPLKFEAETMQNQDLCVATPAD